jgi:hypothetical protein
MGWRCLPSNALGDLHFPAIPVPLSGSAPCANGRLTPSPSSPRTPERNAGYLWGRVRLLDDIG